MSLARLQNKISYSKSTAFLFTSNQQLEFEIKISFVIVSQHIKYSRINLTKDVQVLCTENYKRVLRAIKDLNKWRHTLCPQTVRLNISKMHKLKSQL